MVSRKTSTYSVYAVVGSDRFLRSEALRELIELSSSGGDVVIPSRYEGAEADLAAVLDEVRTLSLLGDRRMVIVDDADPFIQKHRESLERFCANPDSGGIFVLLCNSMPRNTRLYKIIAEHGRIIAVEAPKGRAVVSWVMKRVVEAYGKKMTDPAASRLVDLLGDDLGSLDSELAKLAAFVGERDAILPADIEQMTGQYREEIIFRVMDSIADGQVVGALAAWEQVLVTDRAAPGRAIAGLSWGVRRMLELQRDCSRGVPVAALANRAFASPAVLQNRLERMTRARLEAQQRDLLGADLALKTGLSTIELAVEKVIVKHTVANQRRNG